MFHIFWTKFGLAEVIESNYKPFSVLIYHSPTLLGIKIITSRLHDKMFNTISN